MKVKDIQLEFKDCLSHSFRAQGLITGTDQQLKFPGCALKLGHEKAEKAFTQARKKIKSLGKGQANYVAARLCPSARFHIFTAVYDAAGRTDEFVLRRAISNALDCGAGLKLESLALPALGTEIKGFPVVCAAKIMAQEILKFARKKTSVRRIFLCADEKTSRVFFKNIFGYINHVQEHLGNGPYLTVDCLIEMPQGLVVIERSNPPFGFALPGGFVDNGETLEEAVRREMREETNLELTGLRQFKAYSDPKRDPRFHTVSMVFVAKGQGRPKSGDDAKGLRIMPFDELIRQKFAFDHHLVIKDYLSARSQGLR